MTRRQCAKCPWKTSTDPYDIPGGYDVKKHEALRSTVAEGNKWKLQGGMRVMACHETPIGAELPCVGWMANQLGPGNNIALRMAVAFGSMDGDVETDGPQHRTIEATLPRRRRR